MRVAVVMGPSGSGKTTVGRAAAERADAVYFEADDFHDDSARARMADGRGLTNVERRPWIDRIGVAMSESDTERAVLACSALNPEVRIWLRKALPGEPTFFFLDVPREILAERLSHRGDHYAGPSLLPSQLEALDASETRRLDGTLSPQELAGQIAGWFRGA